MAKGDKSVNNSNYKHNVEDDDEDVNASAADNCANDCPQPLLSLLFPLVRGRLPNDCIAVGALVHVVVEGVHDTGNKAAAAGEEPVEGSISLVLTINI